MGEEPNFDQQQYDFLCDCAKNRNVHDWNNWRSNITDAVEIKLEAADFRNAKIQAVDLRLANLRNANLRNADLKSAMVWHANLQGANLKSAMIQSAILSSANLRDVDLNSAHLEGADLKNANLKGADCRNCFVNDSTVLNGCTISRQTDFRGVALDVCHIDSNIKALLKCNIRRLNWQDWYKQHPKLKYLVKPFWWVSDYGKSPKRLFYTFFGLSFLFATVYFVWGWLAPPGIVSSLYENQYYVKPSLLTFIRAWYFSIVTTTTLGFGDMYAQPGSIWGHILLSIQVIMGYVILGALVTYLGILYNSDGPAGKYAEEIERDERRAARWQKIKNWFRRK